MAINPFWLYLGQSLNQTGLITKTLLCVGVGASPKVPHPRNAATALKRFLNHLGFIGQSSCLSYFVSILLVILLLLNVSNQGTLEALIPL